MNLSNIVIKHEQNTSVTICHPQYERMKTKSRQLRWKNCIKADRQLVPFDMVGNICVCHLIIQEMEVETSLCAAIDVITIISKLNLESRNGTVCGPPTTTWGNRAV
jgi:hypothetical protein